MTKQKTVRRALSILISTEIAEKKEGKYRSQLGQNQMKLHLNFNKVLFTDHKLNIISAGKVFEQDCQTPNY